MTKTPAELPETIEELRALVFLQQENHEVELSERNEEISQLREYIRLLKSQRFGARSERSHISQLGLFNEAEAIADEDDAQTESDVATIEVPAHTRRKRGGRRPLPAFLPREEILHDLSEDEKVCGNDAEHKLVRIGVDRLEQLVFIPASAKVLVHIRPQYACPSCKDSVKAAPPPASPIPKSFATPSLLAQIVTSKYVDALPLYRQAKIFQRMGVDLCRGTMAFWVIRMGGLVVPLLKIFLEKIRRGNYAQMDETPFQVLKEEGKLATTDSYLWALRGGDHKHPLPYSEYPPTRSGNVARQLRDALRGAFQRGG